MNIDGSEFVLASAIARAIAGAIAWLERGLQLFFGGQGGGILRPRTLEF